jgi:hypothetical protein
VCQVGNNTGGTQTVNANTTSQDLFTNTTDLAESNAIRSTNLTTTSATTYGETIATQEDGSVALMEIKVAGGATNWTQTPTDSAGLTDNSANVLTSPPPPVVATITYRGDVVVAPA